MSLRNLCVALVLVIGFGQAFADSGESPKEAKKEWIIEDVMAMGQAEIIELWEQSPAATLEEMDGLFVGYIPFADNPTNEKRIQKVMYNVNSARGFWVGKAYTKTGENKGEGYNKWRHKDGTFTHGQRFATEVGTSLFDGKPALMMYYEAYNSSMKLTDEIRKLTDGIYVGIGTTPQSDGTRRLFGHFVFVGPVHEWVEFDDGTKDSPER